MPFNLNIFKQNHSLNLYLTALGFLLLFVIQPALGQHTSFDYTNRPLMPYDALNLDLTLNLDHESELITGEAEYTFGVHLTTNDTLMLHAAHMDIKMLTWNGQTIDYTAQNDSLLLAPPAEVTPGETFKIKINYLKEYEFGLNRNYKGTVWSSLLPKSHRHWYPVLDHPRNAFTATVHINSSDSAHTVVFSGTPDKGSESWTRKSSTPSTALAFAVGNFEQNSTLAGIKKINLYNEKGLLEEQKKADLMQVAYNALTEIQNLLEIEYPFQSLNLVVLEDPHWETKQYAAGMGFIYLNNNGALEQQVRRIVLAQWIGVQKRETQWLENDATMLLQTWIYNSLYEDDEYILTDKNLIESYESDLYQKFSTGYWGMWVKSYRYWLDNNKKMTQAVDLAGNQFLQSGRNIFNWDILNDYLYRKTGYYWNSRPEFYRSETKDTLYYKVDFLYDDLSDTMRVAFSAVDSAKYELVNATVDLISGQSVTNKDITFTGTTDTVTFTVDGFIDNSYISAPDSLLISFNSSKPMMFWLYQLRNATDVQRKIEAAEELQNYAENPDLQLALLDIMDGIENPRIQAALVQTLGIITDGGIGTEQQFLKVLGSEHVQIRRAALNALENYPENDQVQQRVKRLIDIEEEKTIVNRSLEVYKSIADSAVFKSTAESLLQADKKGIFSYKVLEQLIELGDTTYAVNKAIDFIQPEYPFSVRNKNIQLLKTHHQKIENPDAIFRMMLRDVDPRIRFLSAEMARILNTEEVYSTIENYLPDEYDARVYQNLADLLNTMK